MLHVDMTQSRASEKAVYFSEPEVGFDLAFLTSKDDPADPRIIV